MPSTDNQPTVLVVDDEPKVADVYAKHLSESYAVETAYSGREALDELDHDVDVVLLDRRMPEITGDEVLDRIRRRGFFCRVVFVTAVDPDPEVLSMEFDAYLTKPVSRDDLFEVVEAMLARTEYVRTVQEAIGLTSKLATLESKMDLEELRENEQYHEVQERFHELRGEVTEPPAEGVYSDLAREKLEALFE